MAKMRTRTTAFRMCLLTASSSHGSTWPLRFSFSWRTTTPYSDGRATATCRFSSMRYIIMSKSWSSDSFQGGIRNG